MSEKIKSLIQASIDVKQQLLADDQILNQVSEVVARIVSALKNGNRIWFCGNGGSAADAQHLAAEFSGRFYLNRIALPAEALHCNTSYMTAVANDYSYDVVYSRLVEGICNKGDILIGLSTSGNSVNIINAFETARNKDILTVGFTGASGGKLPEFSDIIFRMPSGDTPRIQESHMLLGHIICQLSEEAYFSS